MKEIKNIKINYKMITQRHQLNYEKEENKKLHLKIQKSFN